MYSAKNKHFPMNIAAFIDHTILKQTTTLAEIDKICAEAAEYGFAAVCIPTVYTAYAAKKLKGKGVKLATVVGFPFGYTYEEVKAVEAEKALKDGANEIDMVINITALKNGDWTSLKEEAKAVASVVQEHGASLKVIIESGILSTAEIIQCCELYRQFTIQFLKTSTGFAEKGASVEAVKLMRQHLPPSINIKASGGIKDYAFAKDLIDAGATRLGCSAGVSIVKSGISNEAGSY